MSVYFATSCGYMKIGYSGNPVQRMSSVTRLGKRPADIPFNALADLIGFIPGDRADEAAVHKRFAEHRVAGEWFDAQASVARELIWADPRGVDIRRMTARAVSVAIRHPDLTRDQIADALAESVECSPLSESHAVLDELLGTPTRARRPA